MKIGFIGAGNMGSALAIAVSKAKGTELLISDLDADKASAVADATGGKVATSEQIAEECAYIFLAVKPKFVESVIDGVRATLDTRDDVVLVSMAAGVTLASLNAFCDDRHAVIRIMPNTPVSVGKGVILVAPNAKVERARLPEFSALLAHAGDVDEIDEGLMDAATALTSCSPAFVYMFIEAMADGGVEVGIPRDKAQKWAAEALMGASTLLIESGRHPGELKDAVCSPGGSTIAGVHALEDGGLRSAVSGAIVASFKKTQELGKK